MSSINVTKTFLPPIAEYENYLKQIWGSDQLTNQGPLLQQFEQRTKEYLDVPNFHFVSNGTVALQLALRALDITEGEIITTPFTYVATTSSILWQGCQPVFVDIDPETLCIDATKIEAAITDKTRAIMPVHVFGRVCDIEAIQAIAERHNLKIIYDAAHAFGVTYKGKSVQSYGDISICSFHATKPFHTIEGGGLIVRDKQVSDKVELLKRFGHNGDKHYMLGINAKATEFQAAMGLCNFPYLERIIEGRKTVSALYDSLLEKEFRSAAIPEDTTYNYAYYPVILQSQEKLFAVLDVLKKEHIFPRRYFYPSLNTLPYIKKEQECPVSEDVAARILCLPLYMGLERSAIEKVSKAINESKGQ